MVASVPLRVPGASPGRGSARPSDALAGSPSRLCAGFRAGAHAKKPYRSRALLKHEDSQSERQM